MGFGEYVYCRVLLSVVVIVVKIVVKNRDKTRAFPPSMRGEI